MTSETEKSAYRKGIIVGIFLPAGLALLATLLGTIGALVFRRPRAEIDQ